MKPTLCSDSLPPRQALPKCLTWRQIRQSWKISETQPGKTRRANEQVLSGDLVGTLSHRISSKSFQTEAEHDPFSERLQQTTNHHRSQTQPAQVYVHGRCCTCGWGSKPFSCVNFRDRFGAERIWNWFWRWRWTICAESLSVESIAFVRWGTYHSVFLDRVWGVISNGGARIGSMDIALSGSMDRDTSLFGSTGANLGVRGWFWRREYITVGLVFLI